jgi:hypothetical protein
MALFDLWLGAGDFRSIIPGWPFVAVAGGFGSLALIWGVWQSWRRVSLGVWIGIIGAAIGTCLLLAAMFGFWVDEFPAFLILVVAPVIFPIMMATSEQLDRQFGVALTGGAYLIGGVLQLWSFVGRPARPDQAIKRSPQGGRCR